MNASISRKARKEMFLLVSGGHICAPQRDTNMSSPFPNISHMKYRTDLLLGQDFFHVYLLSFPDSELSVLNGLHFYF